MLELDSFVRHPARSEAQSQDPDKFELTAVIM